MAPLLVVAPALYLFRASCRGAVLPAGIRRVPARTKTGRGEAAA